MVYFTNVEKEKCVLPFKQNHSSTLVQWWVHMDYGKEAHMRKSIYKWHKLFAETGCICDKRNSMATQITLSDTHEISTLGIHEI
jgi:hypothetical protein